MHFVLIVAALLNQMLVACVLCVQRLYSVVEQACGVSVLNMT